MLLVVDIAHSVGIAVVASGGVSYRLVKFVGGSYYSFIGWTLGLIGLRLLIRNSIDGVYAMVFAAASAFLFSGMLDLTTLHRSHAPFVVGVGWDRVTVVIALGVGLGLAVTGIGAIHRQTPYHDQVEAEGDETLSSA
jgi:hypothetical protein